MDSCTFYPEMRDKARRGRIKETPPKERKKARICFPEAYVGPSFLSSFPMVPAGGWGRRSCDP